MSSALAMVLTAAMAVPGNGPEMVSAEMEQKLDLRGEWVIPLPDGSEITASGEDITHAWKLRDEGNGHFRMTLTFLGSEAPMEGTYRQDGDQIALSVRDTADDPFDTGRWSGGGIHYIILHRVKPRK
jgi:hypothetical protein